MTKKHIHRIYGIVLSMMAVIAGLCLIAACIHINSAGDRTFSAEAVQIAFRGIAIPVYLCVVLIIGGFILDGFFPATKEKKPLSKQDAAILEKLYNGADPALRNNKLRSRRQLLSRISLLWLVVGSALFLLYALDGSNFSVETISTAMAKASVWLAVCMALPFISAVVAAYYGKHSLSKEIEMLKNAGVTPVCSPAPSGKDLSWVRWTILCVGIICMIVGFINGGTEDVLTKAVNICTECVGLG